MAQIFTIENSKSLSYHKQVISTMFVQKQRPLPSLHFSMFFLKMFTPFFSFGLWQLFLPFSSEDFSVSSFICSKVIVAKCLQSLESLKKYKIRIQFQK